MALAALNGWVYAASLAGDVMTDLADVFTTRKGEPGVLLEAEVVNSPADGNDDLYVVIPSFDDSFKWGPALFMPKAGELPSAGDRALVGFSNENQVWVLAWWNGSAAY